MTSKIAEMKRSGNELLTDWQYPVSCYWWLRTVEHCNNVLVL